MVRLLNSVLFAYLLAAVSAAPTKSAIPHLLTTNDQPIETKSVFLKVVLQGKDYDPNAKRYVVRCPTSTQTSNHTTYPNFCVEDASTKVLLFQFGNRYNDDGPKPLIPWGHLEWGQVWDPTIDPAIGTWPAADANSRSYGLEPHGGPLWSTGMKYDRANGYRNARQDFDVCDVEVDGKTLQVVSPADHPGEEKEGCKTAEVWAELLGPLTAAGGGA